MLNPASIDRNFGTTGQSTYLYFTRVFHDANCNLNGQEDLVRIPISSSGRPSGTEGRRRPAAPRAQESETEPSSWTVQCGLWATSQGWPSGSMKIAE